MEFVLALLEAALRSALIAVPLSAVLYVLHGRVRLDIWRAALATALLVAILTFLFLVHLVYAWDTDVCAVKGEGVTVRCDPVGALADAVTRSLLPSVYVGALAFLFASVGALAYSRARIKNKVIRLYIGAWASVLALYVWLVVFPWTAGGLLQLFG